MRQLSAITESMYARIDAVRLSRTIKIYFSLSSFFLICVYICVCAVNFRFDAMQSAIRFLWNRIRNRSTDKSVRYSAMYGSK